MRESRRALRGLPRLAEAPLALLGLAAASPLLAVAAVGTLVTSGLPIVFRQKRVGRGGRLFTLWKLRTMRSGSEGLPLTVGRDPRVTGFGRLLRRTKVDELPQLWNVLRGDMALVGPRPEVPEYVDPEDLLWKEVLAVRPGITDPISLTLRDEETLLAGQRDAEIYYRQTLLPRKLRECAAYLQRRTWRTDLQVLVRTVWELLRRPHPSSASEANGLRDGREHVSPPLSR